MNPDDTAVPALTMLSEEEGMFREAVRDFAVSELTSRAIEMDTAEKLAPEVIEQLFELGLMGIEIPEELGGTVVTMLFIEDPAVSIGERVDAGKTYVGKVRRCPEEIGNILAVYTHDSGSHVNLQVSEEPVR